MQGSMVTASTVFGVIALVGFSQATHAQCESRTVQIDRIDKLALPKARGDCEMNGHNPHIEIQAHVRREGNYLVMTGSVTMTEDRSDWTTFKDTFRERVFVPELEAPGCQFNHINYDSGSVNANGGTDNHQWTQYSGSGVIESAVCLSDTRGDDCGDLGCKISFEPIIVELESED